jgi:hypothetical protein
MPGLARPYYPPPVPPGPPDLDAPPTPLWTPNRITNPNIWLGLEGLIWWTKNQSPSVPLVTTGPASQGANAGGLGMPGTTSLDSSLDHGVVGGFRLYAGGWFTPGHKWGMDGSFFILGQQTTGFGVLDRSGAGSLVINEPVSGAPFNTQVSAPGVETGGVDVTSKTQFGGGDINLMYNLYRGRGWIINLLGGYRYLQLYDTLTVAANSNVFVTTTFTDNLGNVLATANPGDAITVIDQFGARSQFNGGQVGAQFQYWWRLLSITGSAKLGIGATHETVTVNGTTTVFPINGNPVLLNGGNYATLQAGRYSTDRFALAPAFGLNLGYQVLPTVRAQIGYDFLFLSNVVRAANQIDNTYDGTVHPLVPLSSSTFWAQGLSLGLQFNF